MCCRDFVVSASDQSCSGEINPPITISCLGEINPPITISCSGEIKYPITISYSGEINPPTTIEEEGLPQNVILSDSVILLVVFTTPQGLGFENNNSLVW